MNPSQNIEKEFLLAIKWQGDFPKEAHVIVYQDNDGNLVLACKSSIEQVFTVPRGYIVKFCA